MNLIYNWIELFKNGMVFVSLGRWPWLKLERLGVSPLKNIGDEEIFGNKFDLGDAWG